MSTMEAQPLSLQKNGCLYSSTVIHEFLHALGFNHEQSRPDRKNHINIYYENIESGKNTYNIYV